MLPIILAILCFHQISIEAATCGHTHLVSRQNDTIDLLFGSQPQDDAAVRKSMRTVWTIIYICSITIFACSWVSVHANIGPPERGRLRKLWRRLRLMFWSVITPELVIMWAMRQWYAARQLEKTYRGIFFLLPPAHICAYTDSVCVIYVIQIKDGP